MFATQSENTQGQQQRPWNYFGENPDVSGIIQKEDFVDFPLGRVTREFSWAEQVYQAGDTVALVAVYKNLPHHLQYSVDCLIQEEYRKKLFRVPLFKASLLLLSSGCLPGFRSLRERSKRLYSDSCADLQRQKALDFISCRNPEDIVVLVMRSGQLIGTMTLFPFSRKQDIPSLSYLRMDPSFDQLPDVPGLEVGRLAKATSNGNPESCQSNNLTNTMAMAAAFIVAKNFALQNGLLPAADSYIQFIAAVQGRGGWPAVNNAHRRPPLTSEQVLHPDKYFAREPGEEVQIPDNENLLSAGFARIEEDSLGELELGVYLGQGQPSGTDEEAAAGWAGDQLVVYKRGEDSAAVWWTSWDSDEDAQEAFAAARSVSAKDSSSSVERKGRAVLILRGVPHRLHRGLRSDFMTFARAIKDEPPPPEVRPSLIY